MKLNSIITKGEILIIQIPHRFSPKLFYYPSFEKAFETWLSDSNEVFFLPSLTEQINNNFFFPEDEKIIEKIRCELKNVGIDDNTSYYEFEMCSYDKYIPNTKEGREKVLDILVNNDMNRGFIFVSEENETYKEFIEKIYARTRGHNAPSLKSILRFFSLDFPSLDEICEDLIFYAANMKLQNSYFSFQLDVFNKFLKEWNSIQVDKEGATIEQNDKMDATLEEYAEKIQNFWE